MSSILTWIEAKAFYIALGICIILVGVILYQKYSLMSIQNKNDVLSSQVNSLTLENSSLTSQVNSLLAAKQAEDDALKSRTESLNNAKDAVESTKKQLDDISVKQEKEGSHEKNVAGVNDSLDPSLTKLLNSACSEVRNKGCSPAR